MLVRPSTDVDIPAIADIYDHHVRHGISSVETDPPDADEVARRRSKVLQRGLPWLVAEIEGSVLGYAYATQYRSRTAYRFTRRIPYISILCTSEKESAGCSRRS